MQIRNLLNIYYFERYFRPMMFLLLLIISGTLHSNEADRNYNSEMLYQDKQHCIYQGKQGKEQSQIFLGTKLVEDTCSDISGAVDLSHFNNPEDASRTLAKLEKLINTDFIREQQKTKCDISVVGKYKIDFNNAKLSSISTFKENYLNDFVVFINVMKQGEFKIKIEGANSNSCRIVINKILS